MPGVMIPATGGGGVSHPATFHPATQIWSSRLVAAGTLGPSEAATVGALPADTRRPPTGRASPNQRVLRRHLERAGRIRALRRATDPVSAALAPPPRSSANCLATSSASARLTGCCPGMSLGAGKRGAGPDPARSHVPSRARSASTPSVARKPTRRCSGTGARHSRRKCPLPPHPQHVLHRAHAPE